MSAFIHIKDLVFGYREPLTSPINSEIEQGQLVAITGRNGKGKTTFLRTLARLQNPISGEVFLGNQSIFKLGHHAWAKKVAHVFTQRDFDANLYVEDVLSLGRTPYLGLSFKLKPNDKTAIDKAVQQCGISQFLGRQLAELSDGERQKVLLARALVQETPIIILDEPTAHLDIPNRKELFVLLNEVTKKEGKTIVLSSHELDLVNSYADKVIEIS